MFTKYTTFKMQKAKPKHYSAFIIALFICLLYSDIAKKEEKSSSALRRSNLSQEHNVTVIQEEHLKFGEEKEHIIPKRERKAQKDIKYTAFGSSHTWGAALDNRDEDTYVKQLARPYFDNGVNNGIRSSGPNYPANCLYSMIQEEHFDVILLEFYMRASEGMKELAERLRNRFPDAIIVIVRHWMPMQLVNGGMLDERNRPMHLMQYAEMNGFDRGYMHNPEFHELLKTTPDKWTFNYDLYNGQEALLDEVATAISGYVVKTPVPEQRDGPGGWIHFGDQLLSTDSFHPSPNAHAFIANQVREIVERVGVPKHPRVNPFNQKDQCYSWLMDGKLDPSLTYGDSFKLTKMPNTEKYSLEFQNDVPLDGENGANNYITVENHADEIMDLFIGYLTTSPEQKYPTVEAYRTNGKKFQLQPHSVDKFGGKSVHVPEMVHLGFMKHKSSVRIYFKPLEESEWPFRITSIMITPQVETENPFFHALAGSPLP